MIELPLVPVILESKVLFLPTDEADVSGGRFISGTRLIALGYFPRELASSLTQPPALASPPPPRCHGGGDPLFFLSNF